MRGRHALALLVAAGGATMLGSCGSDDEKAIPTTVAGLCQALWDGISAAGCKRGLEGDDGEAGWMAWCTPERDAACADRFRAWLDCFVRTGEYVCDPASGEMSIRPCREQFEDISLVDPNTGRLTVCCQDECGPPPDATDGG